MKARKGETMTTYRSAQPQPIRTAYKAAILLAMATGIALIPASKAETPKPITRGDEIRRLKADVKLLRASLKRQRGKVAELEKEVRRLKALCRERGIDPTAKPKQEKPKRPKKDAKAQDRAKIPFDELFKEFHDKIALVDGEYYDIGWQKLRLETLNAPGRNAFRRGPPEPWGSQSPPREVGRYRCMGGYVYPFATIKVQQIIGPKELLALPPDDMVIHLKGMSTKGMVTGDYLLQHWVVYIGPYQYRTTQGGTHTVRSYELYRPLTKEQFADALAKGFKLHRYRLKPIRPPRFRRAVTGIGGPGIPGGYIRPRGGAKGVIRRGGRWYKLVGEPAVKRLERKQR